MDIQVWTSADIHVCTSNMVHAHLRAHQGGVMRISARFRLIARRVAGLLGMIRMGGMLRMFRMASLRIGVTCVAHNQAPLVERLDDPILIIAAAEDYCRFRQVKTWNKVDA
jgi:hypothetical protein